MDSTNKKKLIEKAKALEKSGQLKSAYQAYLSANSFQDAARLLASAGKPEDAGRLIMNQLKVNPDKVGRLDGTGRKLAYLAATYLAKSSHMYSEALEIFLALGERNRAAEILERKGDMVTAERIRSGKTISMDSENRPEQRNEPQTGHRVAASRLTAERLEREGRLESAVSAYIEIKQYADAARLLRSLGYNGKAANLYAEAGMAYEAGVCYLEVGDTGRALDTLTRVQRNDPEYRLAASRAIHIASKLNVLNFQLEHFLADFVAHGPKARNEFPIFFTLGDLYKRHGLVENAKEAILKVLSIDPQDAQARAQLDSITTTEDASSQAYARIRHQDESYIGSRGHTGPAPRPDAPSVLPTLPELPDLPPPPRITGLDLSPEGIPIPSSHPNSPIDKQQIQMAETISIQGGEDPPYGEIQRDVSTNRSAYLFGGEISPSEGAPNLIVETPAMVAPERPELDFTIGKVIANRYRLISELGRGGMAMVYEAYDLELDEDIALKVFLQQVSDPEIQKESLARFRQELKLSRQLVHPNIIRLYDIGLHFGHRYISMELLRGSVLEDLLHGPLDFARGLAYLVQICAGLHAAHDKGVVHRDIKPENLFVTDDEIVKVMDFGIAKNTHVRGLTMEGMTAGTPEYIAPEQINDFSNVTAAADQYALGLIAYRMFTGTLPFQHEELTPLLLMHLHHKPKPPRELNPEIPETLDGIILKLLEKKPQNRFSSCMELASHLKKLRPEFKRV